MTEMREDGSWWKAEIQLENEVLFVGTVWAPSADYARKRIKDNLRDMGKVALLKRWRYHYEPIRRERNHDLRPARLPLEAQKLRNVVIRGGNLAAALSDGKVILYRNRLHVLTVPESVAARGVLWESGVRIRQPWVIGVKEEG